MLITGNVMIIAGGSEHRDEIYAALAERGIVREGNSDVYDRTYRFFGVDEAREVRERAGSKAAAGGQRVFIIEVAGMTTEAQNALLKTLEEPPADALFFFLVPSPAILLPTVRSRAQIMHLSSPPARGEYPRTMEGWRDSDGVVPRIVAPRIDPKQFLSASPAERLDMLKPLLEKGDDDKRDTGEIIAFLAALERELAGEKSFARKRESLRALYRTRKFLDDKGALVKPLLEQLALA